jgi:hypothetical protein
MIKRFLIFMLPCLAFGQVRNSSILQKGLLKNISASLNTYIINHPTEKTYLQFDKPYYAIGDTIYFKAYITTDSRHVLSALSGILHVELINAENKIVRELRLQIINGTTWGDFTLPDSLFGGNYRVRAYTAVMHNDGDSVFYEQAIPVTGLYSKTTIDSNFFKSKIPQAKPVIRFFPEGGSLLNGVKSKIAFKAIAANGLSIDVKGIVTDNEDKQVAVFNSTHLGMGIVTFRPLNGKTYKARVVFADGTENVVDLPTALHDGYALAIDTVSDDTITVDIISRDRGSSKPKDALTLIAQSGGVIYSAAKSNPDSKEFIVRFSRKTFPSGIIQFTLFSADGEPLSERLLFVRNADQVKLDINITKSVYTARDKVKIELVAKNRQDKPTAGSFSVAITDETKVPVDEITENTILTNLLLTSEVKGNIENPNYYFTNQNDKTLADLDILMLTQGYRRFEWKKILNNGYSQGTYDAEKAGLQLAGYIKNGKAAVPNGKIRLFSKSAGGMVLDTVSDANGRFVFDNLVFADTEKFIIQARTAKGQKNVDIEMDKTADAIVIPITAQRDIPPGNTGNLFSYSKSAKQFYDEQLKYGINKHVQMLKEVVVKEKKIPKELENSENLNGKGQADQVITAKDFENFACGRIMDCLQSKLNSVIVQYGKLYSSYSKSPYYDPELKMTTYAPMAVVIDGSRSDYEALHSLNVADVDAFEIILGAHGGAIYGPFGANGVIIVTTKRAKKINNYYREAPGVIVYTAKGFYKAREFYSPQYDNPKTNQKMADLRSTIYWNANIITDKDGKASFEYFNADSKGTYRVVVEGIDADGNLGRQVYRYKVE